MDSSLNEIFISGLDFEVESVFVEYENENDNGDLPLLSFNFVLLLL